MIVTEYTYNVNIVRIIEEEKTEEEKAAQQKRIEQATAQFLRKALAAKAKAEREALL